MHGSERGAGDTQARGVTPENAYWADLYEKYHEEVRARFARSVPCPHDVEDLVQNVFTGLIRRGGTLTHPYLSQLLRGADGPFDLRQLI